MSARRALLVGSSSVTCHVCSSIGPPRASGAYRRYSSPRKVLPADSGGSTKRTASAGRVSPTTASVSHLPPVPKHMAAYLDEYVIGQDHAKRALAVGVFNHYLRAASNRNMVVGEDLQPVLYAEKGKPKRVTRSKEGGAEEEGEAVLTDFPGQLKGSERWDDSCEAGNTSGKCKIGKSSMPLLNPFGSREVLYLVIRLLFVSKAR